MKMVLMHENCIPRRLCRGISLRQKQQLTSKRQKDMDRRKFLKSASGLALMAAGALTGTSRVLAATDAMAATDKDKGRTGRQSKAERRNLGGMSVSPIGLGCLPMVGYYGGRYDRRDMVAARAGQRRPLRLMQLLIGA